jgi:hypothetical protein
MPAEMANWVGLVLAGDRYQVTSKLGEGGMGLVYRASDATATGRFSRIAMSSLRPNRYGG